MEICGVWVQAEGGVKVIQIGMEPCMARGRRAARARPVEGSTRRKMKARTTTFLQLYKARRLDLSIPPIRFELLPAPVLSCNMVLRAAAPEHELMHV